MRRVTLNLAVLLALLLQSLGVCCTDHPSPAGDDCVAAVDHSQTCVAAAEPDRCDNHAAPAPRDAISPAALLDVNDPAASLSPLASPPRSQAARVPIAPALAVSLPRLN